MEVRERFESKFIAEPMSGCWLWEAGLSSKGYGIFRVKCRNIYAHRFSYELYVDRIPAAMFVLHRCDNPACINPDHLWLGTQQDNIRDRKNKGRCHFKTGHTFTVGTKSGRTHLTEEDVLEIYSQAWSGTKLVDLARRFRINPRSVSDIKLGKNWAHLTQGKEV